MNDYNKYMLIRNTALAVANTTLGISVFGTSVFYYGYRTPSTVIMTGVSFMATGCLYRIARDYHLNALYVKDKELKK